MWKLATEGAPHPPEGLWPEGGCGVPEVANDTHALHEWVGVTFMHVHGKRDNLHFHRHDTEIADYGYVADFNILKHEF